MDQSTLLGLPYLLPNQAQKHVSHNEALQRLDALTQISVVSRSVGMPPATPSEGIRYLVPVGAAGDWAAHADTIAAFQQGGWVFYAPVTGWLAWIEDDAALLVWDGAAWVASSGTNPAPLVGVNTVADNTNRLAAKSDAVLFSHDDVSPGSGDSRVKINKAAAAQTASVLFQSGWSGRAEFGLAGDDNWRVKVSADGSTWYDAITVRGDNGQVGIGSDTPLAPLQVSGSDKALALENALDAGEVWSIVPGRPGLYEGYLIIAAGDDINDVNSHAIRIAPNGAPGFANGAEVADGTAFRSASSASIAYYKPFTGSRAETAFRGAAGSATSEYRIIGYYDDNGWSGVTVGAWKAEPTGPKLGVGTNAPSTTLHVDGPARVGSFTVATLPSASGCGAGSIIFVADETGGAALAFSDGTDWRRSSDRSVVS